jgi:hypothetical protein
VYVYDADGLPLDGSATEYIDLVGGWAWYAGGYYGFGANVGVTQIRILIQSLDVHFIRIQLWTGSSTAGTGFDFVDIVAFGEEPWRRTFAQAAVASPQPIRQASTPTKCLLPLYAIVRTSTADREVSFRLDTTLSVGASSAATSITVTSGTGVTVGDLIAVLLTDRSTHFTTASSVSGTTIGLTAGLASGASSGAPVIFTRLEDRP